MTPQLQQAIKMLQLSNLELINFIDGEIQQNPLLERHEPVSGDAAPGTSGERERPTPVELPERLTGDFTPDAAERWQPEWGDEGTARWTSAANLNCGPAATEGKVRQHTIPS